ncbi:hypothetical protein [Aneurinibacillus aneurinilyticus]|uniref:hypothetical protein n=1 Tax=Aneurinibacillus aneurinilyticus TaxID=1391 RepID=UPI003525B798
MAEIAFRRPDMLLKLTATSVGLAMASAKLISYHINVFSEKQKDIQYVNDLKDAYMFSSEQDEMYAEAFTEISAQVDNLLMELDEENE